MTYYGSEHHQAASQGDDDLMNHASARWGPHRDALADRVMISKRQTRRIQIDQAVSHLFAVA